LKQIVQKSFYCCCCCCWWCCCCCLWLFALAVYSVQALDFDASIAVQWKFFLKMAIFFSKIKNDLSRVEEVDLVMISLFTAMIQEPIS